MHLIVWMVDMTKYRLVGVLWYLYREHERARSIAKSTKQGGGPAVLQFVVYEMKTNIDFVTQKKKNNYIVS